MMHAHRLRYTLTGGMMGLALAIGATQLLTSANAAEDQPQPQIVVGTYNPEAVFNAYHGRTAFIEQMQELQAAGQQAQQQGDQEQLMQVQQQAQLVQQRAIQGFQNDVSEAMPDVAEATGAQLIVLEVVHSGPNVETLDVTAEVIEKVNEGQQGGAEPQLPGGAPLPPPGQ